MLKAADLETELIDTVCARVRDASARRAGGAVRDLRAPVLPLGTARGSGRPQPARSVRRRGRALEPGPAPRARARPRSTSTTPSSSTTAGSRPHTVVEIVSDDMPFIVDSVTMELGPAGVRDRPRDPSGDPDAARRGRATCSRSSSRVSTTAAPIAESILHVEVARETDRGALLRAVARTCARVLGEVRAAVEDWQPMRGAGARLIDELDVEPPPRWDDDELAEVKAFLAWLADDHFTFLGYREYELVTRATTQPGLRAVPDSGLGILRGSPVDAVHEAQRRRPWRWRRSPHVLVLTKANSRATVHRPAYLDYIGVKRFDADGHGHRRAPLPRPVHDVGLQGERARDPAPARQGRRRPRAGGLSARQPRRQGATRDHRVLPARVAVPDGHGRSVHDRDGDPRARRASARAAVRPPRPARPLRRVPRLHPARSLQHREPGAGGADPDRRVRRRPTSTGRCSSPSRCSCASTTSSTRPTGSPTEHDVSRDRGAARAGDPRVDRRSARRR